MDRRTFLKGALAGAGAAAVGASAARAESFANVALPSLRTALDPPSKTPVKHLVVVMMENRSVDHYLGWYAQENDGFDGRQQASFVSPSTGLAVPTSDWGANGRGDFHGRGHPDPAHGWGGGREEWNLGACDGWLRAGNDEFAISYYQPDDVPVWARMTREWQAYDRWFCSVLGPTQPNRYYLHSAQSGGWKNNTLPPETGDPRWMHGWDWPTIWSQMEAAELSCAYYFANVPEILFWGERHIRHARHISEFYAAAAAGQLPAVSFIDPWFSEPQGVANDDHPHADLRLGQEFLSDLLEAFTTSPNYRDGAMVVTYDEWGGFWDHVAPPRLADDRATSFGDDNDFGQLGFRVPTSIVSPWTTRRPGRGNRVDHTIYEHSSIIKFVTDNWNLGPYLTTRHGATNSIEAAFRTFREYQPEPPAVTRYDAPADVVVDPYVGSTSEGSDLHRLGELGWFDTFGIRTDWRLEDSYLHRRPWMSRLPVT
ncbi:MAG TPA: alkaline phosphatase family protein [Acidimicrobiales bacterium]